MRLCFLSLSLSLQDSMDEACAEGMANEHYRLEGRLPSCSSSSLSPLFILFLHEKPRKYSPQLHSRYSCGSFPLQSFIPPPPPPPSAPHPSSKPQQCADEVPFTFHSLLSTSSSVSSLICSSPPPPPAVLHSSMFPPSRCDVILD